MKQTATLIDCPTCEQTRSLQAEVAWLRKRVVMPPCERCKRGGHRPRTFTIVYGFEAVVCPSCWDTGDRFYLQSTASRLFLRVESRRRVVVEHPAGETTIDTPAPTEPSYGVVRDADGNEEWFELDCGRMGDGRWAERWYATGLVTLDGPGSGVMAQAYGVSAVLQALPVLAS